MDPPTSLRRRVGDTPLVKAPALAAAAGLPGLRLKMEGANPTGTQKDRIARLEVQNAVGHDAPGITIASCGNFGVAVAHAAFVHELPCAVFIPADFRGERVALMEDLGATVERVPGTYEDAVAASREHARAHGWFDGNPGGANTLGTLVGYSTIAKEVVDRLGAAPVAVGVPVGNGSTLAGVHLGFRTAWAQGRTRTVPHMLGGTSDGNNPLPDCMAGAGDVVRLEAGSLTETPVNEPLVNWDALDAHACMVAVRDSRGAVSGHSDEELLSLHAALLEDGIDAHPASLSAVAALRRGAESGLFPADAQVVAVMTSGRPQLAVAQVQADRVDRDALIAQLRGWLGPYGDPDAEMQEAVGAALTDGFVFTAHSAGGIVGYVVLTPMELSTFFPRYHLSYIAVSPDARGLGVGSLLLEEAIRATHGDLSLHVETKNEPAIRLYEKFGFAPKYYRMLYKGARATRVDPAAGSGWVPQVPAPDTTAITAGSVQVERA